jgi:hypothetical protein
MWMFMPTGKILAFYWWMRLKVSPAACCLHLAEVYPFGIDLQISPPIPV